MGILFSFYVLAFSLYLKKNEQMNANGDRFLNSFKRFIMTNMTVTEKKIFIDNTKSFEWLSTS